MFKVLIPASPNPELPYDVFFATYFGVGWSICFERHGRQRYHHRAIPPLWIAKPSPLQIILLLLVVWNMTFIFPYIGNVIIPFDFSIFQMGRLPQPTILLLIGDEHISMVRGIPCGFSIKVFACVFRESGSMRSHMAGVPGVPGLVGKMGPGNLFDELPGCCLPVPI